MDRGAELQLAPVVRAAVAAISAAASRSFARGGASSRPQGEGRGFSCQSGSLAD